MSQTDPAARYQAAAQLFRQRDFSGALSILDELIASSPNAAPLHFHRSRSLLALERREEAAAALDRVLRLAPDHVPALLARAELGTHAEDDFDALPLLRHALQQEPDNARVLYLLAEAELNRSDDTAAQTRALAHLDRSLEQDPNQPAAFALRAEHHYTLALTDQAGEHTIRTLMGISYDRRALEAALADYERAAALEQNNRYDRRVAQIAETLGHYETATAHLDRVLARLPADAPARPFLQEERDRCAQGESGAREQLATMIEAAGAPAQAERNLEEDMAYAVTHSAAALIRQGQDMENALNAVAGDDSPEAMMATNIAFQIYNYANEPAPDLIEVSPGDYPTYQRKHADACEKALAPLGYTKLADVEPLGVTTSQGMRALVRLFVHPQYGSAAAFALKPKWPGFLAFLLLLLTGKWKAARMLECSTRFTDNFFMGSRAAGPDPFDNSAIANISFEKLPADAAPAQVAEHHIARVEARIAEGHQVLPATSLEEVEDTWATTTQIKNAYRRSIGFVTDEELRNILGNRHDALAERIRDQLKLLGHD